MRTTKRVMLALGVTLAATHVSGTEASARRLFFQGHDAGHFDTVMGNYSRRCSELDAQFVRERAGRPDSSYLREASALYDVGSAHCRGGAGLTAIDELSEAIKRIGGIPHTSF